MSDFAAAAPAPPEGNQLVPRLCGCGCGRQSTRASGYRFSFFCDPGIDPAVKRAVRRRGGWRGLTAMEAGILFHAFDPSSAESRVRLRVRLMQLRATGKLASSIYRDLAAGLDGIGKDQCATPPPPKPVTIRVHLADMAKDHP